MSLLEPVRLPWCDVLMTEAWKAPPGRRFAAFRARHGFRWMLGHVVLEEFGTISSPLFLAPRPSLGRIYDAGISLGHRRDREMAVDLGWPPLCIGIEGDAPALPAGWQAQMLDAIASGSSAPSIPALAVQRREAGPDALEVARFPASDRAGSVCIVACSAPLLPQHLGRLCDLDDSGLTLAFAMGNRVTRQADARPQALAAVSESRLRAIADALAGMLAAAVPDRPRA
jgi:hypothetical protein